MNQRKQSFLKGLRTISRRRGQKSVLKNTQPVGVIGPRLYNSAGMPETNQIIHGDSIKTLNDGPEAWVDLVFADPPFNIGYLYHNYDDRKNVDEYVDWSEQWMRAVYRALKPTGSFYLAIGDEFAADLCVAARRKIGFHMRNWIIWHYTFGQQTKKMFAKSHTHILYFTKQKPDAGQSNLTFNADAIRVASARQTTYGDSRANPKGKLPDDTWFLRPQETVYVEPGYREFAQQWTKSGQKPVEFFDPTSDTWNESRVCGTFKEREGWHGCQMPMAVLDRIIKASSNPGDIVLDPFNGSGTTVVSAALNGRKYVGIDQSAEYVEYARKRLAHALSAGPSEINGKAVAAVFDPKRASKVMTETDAFGRKRVARGPRQRRAVAKTA
jgi:site-specific DNA-methyltransferase (adenine-specific)